MLIYVGNFSLFVQLKNDNNLIKFHFFFAFVIKNCTHFRDVWVCVWGVLVDWLEWIASADAARRKQEPVHEDALAIVVGIVR